MRLSEAGVNKWFRIVFTNMDYVACSIVSRAELLGGKGLNSANLKSDSLYFSQLIMHQIASKTSF